MTDQGNSSDRPSPAASRAKVSVQTSLAEVGQRERSHAVLGG